MGEEDIAVYNARVEEAFAERRFKAWPYEGGVVVEERSRDRQEKFLIDNWCLLASIRSINGTVEQDVYKDHRFDYDSYRIIAGYVFTESNRQHIRPASKEEIATLIRQGQAA